MIIDACPHCGREIHDDIYEASMHAPDEFDMDCPHCEKLVHVSVEMDPSYYLTKGESDDDT